MQTIARSLALAVLIAGTVASSSIQAGETMAPSGSDKPSPMMQGGDMRETVGWTA